MDTKVMMETCAAVYLIAVLIEFILKRLWLRAGLGLAALVLVLVFALLLNNSVNGAVSLGAGQSPLVSIVIMFGAVVLGTMARYFFYMAPGTFSWLELVKPVTISPIVLLPLIGSVQAVNTLNSMQLVSFGFLAFQNGFFWQAALNAARPATQASGGNHDN